MVGSLQAAFDEGIERVCEIAPGTSERCDAMRQCSPMGFIFSREKERQHFLRHWRTMWRSNAMPIMAKV